MENKNHSSQPIEGKEQNSNAHTIISNGKMRRLKATGVDIFISILLPLIGFIIGFIAVCRGEKKRGLTMMLIGLGAAFMVALSRLS